MVFLRWKFLKKLGIKPPYDPAIPLLGMHLQKPGLKKTHVFTAALFTVARTWKQPRCPSTDEWIKLWYIYTMEHYSAINMNTFESVLLRQMNLELIIQSESERR